MAEAASTVSRRVTECPEADLSLRNGLTNYQITKRELKSVVENCIELRYRLTIEERRRGHCRGLVEREPERGA